MSLNKGAINNHAINASVEVFVSQTGGGVVVSIAQEVQALSTATNVVDISQIVGALSTATNVVDIAQIVGVVSTQTLVASIAQEVLFNSISTPGIVVSIAQEVKALGTKTIDIEQVVVLATEPTTFFGRNGYEPILYIDGERVPSGDIHDLIECIYTENEAPQLSFTLIPDTGVQDVRSYRGKTVVYKIRESGTIKTMFTGKINVPKVDVLNQKITFNCSLDMKQNTETLLSRSSLNSIGYYNNNVFPVPTTKLQELQDRVSTIPSVLTFNKVGNPVVSLIANAASPHYTLTDANVQRTDINFKLGSGQRFVNKININVNYSYQRLHHHERNYTVGVGYSSVCDLLTGGHDVLTRSLVGTAVRGSEWKLKGAITYVDIYPSGWYSCNFVMRGWSTTQVTGQTIDKIDAFGDPVLHNGVQVRENTITSIKDNTLALCNGASWVSTKRFSQNIDNTYVIAIEAPQSQAQNGVKEIDTAFNLSSSFKSEEWEDYNSYTTNTPLAITGTSGSNYWIDASTNKTTLNDSINILMNKAKSEILKSHREDRVMFRRPLWTDIDLTQTIKLNCTKVVATGRVYTYTHVVNASSGESYTTAELSLSQSTGTATDSVLSLPPTLTNTPNYPTASINLGNGHYGADPTQSGAESWVGHIANKYGLNGVKTQYPVSFVLDTPDIADDLRQLVTLASLTSYDVEIPNDSITINFDQWT